ncbi:hypothetical protein BP6252_04899 [Coleophoma cylindrospora]|uniref:Uncharacterized protein n=1 Tax=Coleophoma cylindrospora TaxID=1849047 RepID=A0A3D8S2C9_9HELO|nr:hypothetical protein BP6252_04899 [Coleophoma cylindrospora]
MPRPPRGTRRCRLRPGLLLASGQLSEPWTDKGAFGCTGVMVRTRTELGDASHKEGHLLDADADADAAVCKRQLGKGELIRTESLSPQRRPRDGRWSQGAFGQGRSARRSCRGCPRRDLVQMSRHLAPMGSLTVHVYLWPCAGSGADGNVSAKSFAIPSTSGHGRAQWRPGLGRGLGSVEGPNSLDVKCLCGDVGMNDTPPSFKVLVRTVSRPRPERDVMAPSSSLLPTPGDNVMDDRYNDTVQQPRPSPEKKRSKKGCLASLFTPAK